MRAGSVATPRTVRPRLVHALVAAALVAAGPVVTSAPAHAAGGAFPLQSPHIDPSNERSLQNGAKAFVNYCMGCHSAGYNRYSRVAQDLGLSEEDVEQNLIFTTDEDGEPTKIGALMENNMTKEYGRQAFGVMPPNLSLVARSRGEDWIYTMLKSYYLDPDRAGTGVNNLVWPGTAMPHVLWNLQGWQAPVVEEVDGHSQVVAAELLEPGAMGPEEYDDFVADITNLPVVHVGPGARGASSHRFPGDAVPDRAPGRRLLPEEGILEGRRLTTSAP